MLFFDQPLQIVVLLAAVSTTLFLLQAQNSEMLWADLAHKLSDQVASTGTSHCTVQAALYIYHGLFHL